MVNNFIYTQKINFYYLHELFNNFRVFLPIKITHSFFNFYIFKPDLIELFHQSSK